MPADDGPRPGSADHSTLRTLILDLLEQRAPGASICPSDAARHASEGDGEGWRALMQPVRDAAAVLAEEGFVHV